MRDTTDNDAQAYQLLADAAELYADGHQLHGDAARGRRDAPADGGGWRQCRRLRPS